MAPKTSTNPIRIGTAGWSIPRLFATEFASELPTSGTHLERYAQAFSCCEINTSFYRSHLPATWSKWANAVPDNFRFSVKAPKTITHDAKLANTTELLKSFLSQAKILTTKLGPLLFQLPPKLAFDPATAETFLKLLRDLHPGHVAFEPRHATWFTAEADDLLQRFHIARVAADPPLAPQGTTPGGWSGLVYYRLHGSPRVYYSSYEDEFLTPLASALATRPATTDAWCIFDNTASGAALGNANRLQQLTTL